MDRQQAINLGLLRAFEREGIALASATPALQLTLPKPDASTKTSS